MYYQVISQCTQSLKNLETCLDKAEQHAAAKKFDAGVLMTSRLAPDMQHFIYQVQSACDYVKAAAAWLSGQTPPKHEDNEQTIDELRPHPEDRRFRGEREGGAVRGREWCSMPSARPLVRCQCPDANRRRTARETVARWSPSVVRRCRYAMSVLGH